MNNSAERGARIGHSGAQAHGVESGLVASRVAFFFPVLQRFINLEVFLRDRRGVSILQFPSTTAYLPPTKSDIRSS